MSAGIEVTLSGIGVGQRGVPPKARHFQIVSEVELTMLRVSLFIFAGIFYIPATEGVHIGSEEHKPAENTLFCMLS